MPFGSIGIDPLLVEKEEIPQDQKPNWISFPTNPIDAFAVSALLVENSGAYRNIVAPSSKSETGFDDPYALIELRTDPNWNQLRRAWAAGFHPFTDRSSPQWKTTEPILKELYCGITDGYREKYEENLKLPFYDYDQFAEFTDATNAGNGFFPLQELWNDLTHKYGDYPVVADSDQPQDWWQSAVRLMVIADMACGGVGFFPYNGTEIELRHTMVSLQTIQLASRRNRDEQYLTTIASALVDKTICAVLPKTRTAALGCTLRSVTHNLALLPQPGQVEARWRIPPPDTPAPRAKLSSGAPNRHGDKEEKTLNILLVPFPYRFGSKCFVADPKSQKHIDATKSDGATGKNLWGYYHIEQCWLHENGENPADLNVNEMKPSRSRLAEFVKGLRDAAEKDMGEIHAVIFPEMSLDLKSFDSISRTLFAEEKVGEIERCNLEFIVAGLSEEPAGTQKPNKGNFAVMRGKPQEGYQGDTNAKWSYHYSRSKHHRWKLEKRQIERYGLSYQLDPQASWWEAIPLGRRTIDFFEPRAGTSMTILICEDLARAEPVQSIVRSIGPNLVVALLMDGPQRKHRWPGHYAGVLADDPGSSVLTFTSLGLVNRGATSDRDQNRNVAFFKNSSGEEREIFLPNGFHAVALRLTAKKKTETTLDGRGDGGAAYIWELSEVTPVRGKTDPQYNWIIYGST